MENHALGPKTIPPEILNDICLYMSLSRENFFDTKQDKNKSELFKDVRLVNFCRCSKLLYAVGLPYLYHILQARMNNIAPLTRTLIERPDLANLAQKLFIETYWCARPRPPREHMEMFAPQLKYTKSPQPGEYEFTWSDRQQQAFTRDMVPLVLKETVRLETLVFRIDISSLSPRSSG
ncbi:Fc.00g023230.m01.CDS01 [Cosmosporella sp. VM-42]